MFDDMFSHLHADYRQTGGQHCNSIHTLYHALQWRFHHMFQQFNSHVLCVCITVYHVVNEYTVNGCVYACKRLPDVKNVLQITDQGGGIPRSEIHNLFNYMYSTAPRPPSPELIEYTPLASIFIFLHCIS